VIIHNRYVFRSRRSPTKTDSPLLVDPNTVLARTVTSQLLEPITWRDSQVIQLIGGVED
jgi:hypothetical protein